MKYIQLYNMYFSFQTRSVKITEAIMDVDTDGYENDEGGDNEPIDDDDNEEDLEELEAMLYSQIYYDQSEVEVDQSGFSVHMSAGHNSVVDHDVDKVCHTPNTADSGCGDLSRPVSVLEDDTEDDEDERSPSPDHIYVYQADGSLKPCWKGVYGSLPGKSGKYNSREWRKDPPAPASSVENTVYVCKARGVHEGCGMQFEDQVRFHQDPVELENLRRLLK